jgi:hypothetical protein
MPTKPATAPDRDPLPVVQQIVSVMWPSFLTASIATIVFFTIFDPLELSQVAGGPEVTRLGGYTIGFFAFWLLTSISCALTCYFRRPCPPRKALPQASTPDRPGE